MSELQNVIGEWQINIDVTCPKCDDWIEVLDYYPMLFADYPKIQVGEKITTPIEVICENCDHEFTFTIE